MHVGLVMERDDREGRTQEEAFAEALSIAEPAEVAPRLRPARQAA